MTMKLYDCDCYLKPRGAVSYQVKAGTHKAAEISARVRAKQDGYDNVTRVVARPVGEKVGPNGEGWG